MFYKTKMAGLTAIAMIAAFHASAPAQEPAQPFANEIREFGVQDEVRMPAHCGLLFVGSSSIRLWVGLEQDFAGLDPIQRGFGGSQTEHANLHFDRLVTRYRPARIVFYEGENDIDAGKDADMVMADFKAFLAMKDAALGSTPVYFIAVKPSLARAGQLPRQAEYNARVRALADQRDDLVFIDVATAMMQADGTVRSDLFISDGLHMNAKGYAIWRGLVLDALVNAPASTAPHCATVS